MSLTTQSISAAVKKYPLLFVASIVVIGLLVVRYSRDGAAEAQQEELDRHAADARQQHANIVNTSLLHDQLSFLIQANSAVRERSLVVGGLAQNLQYFYRLENEVGIKYLDLRPGTKAPSVKGASYVPLNYIVNVQGDYSQVMTFLRHLERGAYFCRINSAVMGSGGGFVTLNLNIDFLGAP